MVNVVISSDPRYKINKAAIKDCITGVLALHKVTGEAEVEVVIVGDRKMRELNKKFRRINDTTDILSFCLTQPTPVGFISLPDKTLRLGSIVISYPQALINAQEDNKSMEMELNFLVEHGCNHLLGIHHD